MQTTRGSKTLVGKGPGSGSAPHAKNLVPVVECTEQIFQKHLPGRRWLPDATLESRLMGKH